MPRINFDNRIKSRTWITLLVAVLLASSAVLQLTIVAGKGAAAPETVAANVPVGGGPTGIAFDSGNNMLYVTDNKAGNVSVVNDTTLKTSGACYPSCHDISTTIQLAKSPLTSCPTSVAADPTDSEVFVSDTCNNKVHVISTSSNADIKQISLTGTPEGIAWDAANDIVYVGNGAGGLNGISPTTNAIVSSLVLSGTPSGVAIDSTNGEIFVALQSAGKVVSVVASTDALNKTITVGSNPQGVAFNSAKNTIFVANHGSGTVSIVTVLTDKSKPLSVGSGPTGVTYDSTAKDVYVSNTGSATVSVISGTKIKATIGVSASPMGLTYDSKNSQVDVANQGMNSVSVIATTYLTYAGPSTLPSGTITYVGSSLMLPMIVSWDTGFGSPSGIYPNVVISAMGGGSGFGQLSIEQGTYLLGGSDGYLNSTSFHSTYPEILEIPLAISSQTVTYNVPQIPSNMNLNLSGPLLSSIYNGTIQYWDDPAIVAANPGAVNIGGQTLLPHQLIYPFHRAETTGSGDTYIFTQYLSLSDPWWATNVGYGVVVTWPNNPNNKTAIGNSGMVAGVQATQYSLAYVGVSALNTAEADGEGYAFLQNQAGNYVNLTNTNVEAAVTARLALVPPDEQISLEFAPGANTFPIVNFEYIFVRDNQSSAADALRIRTFMSWAVDPNNGNSLFYLNQQHFLPLPASVRVLTQAQIEEIGPFS